MSQPAKMAARPALSVVDGSALRQAKWPAPPAAVREALRILVEAHECAEQFARPRWDFAVEVDEFRAAGVGSSALRWLVCRGLAEHGREIVGGDDGMRRFQRGSSLCFAENTCFVLAEAGIAFARQPAEGSPSTFALMVRCDGHRKPPSLALKPTWDCERQELRVGQVVIKQFKVPAANQQMVLAAFEEENWPVRIDDPLPPQPEQDSKRRLHETITSLNRNQRQPLLHFSGDGTGQGVRWDLADPPGNGMPRHRTTRLPADCK